MIVNGLFRQEHYIIIKITRFDVYKNKVIANNIANANTPGYKKVEASFMKELQKAIESNKIEKVKNVEENITFSKSKSTRKDGTTLIWIES